MSRQTIAFLVLLSASSAAMSEDECWASSLPSLLRGLMLAECPMTIVSCLDCLDGFAVQKHGPWLPRFWTCAKFYTTGSASTLLDQKMLPHSLIHGGSNGNKEVNRGAAGEEKAPKLHHHCKHLFQLVSLPSYRNHWWGGVSKQWLTISGDCLSDTWRWFPNRVHVNTSFQLWPQEK